jgi:type IV secretion system protein VirB9
MPSSMKYSEAPIFMVLDKGDNNQLVNYRLKENNYIVDKLFKKGMLIIGVGEDQEKIIITQKGLKQSTNLWGDDDEQY